MDVSEERSPFWQRHRWLMWTGISVLVVLVALATTAAILLHRAEPYVKERIIADLEEKFHAHVELDSFHLSLVDGFEAEGQGLRIWPPITTEGLTITGPVGNGDPLIRLQSFHFHAPLNYHRGQPFHIGMVHLHGIYVDLPPREQYSHASIQTPNTKIPAIIVDGVECEDAHLKLETNKPGKLPMEIAIAHLKLTNPGDGKGILYEADLTNPKPVGTVHTEGTFGPWNMADTASKLRDPGAMPIEGTYTFSHADLASFRGIAGILNSTGHYQGTLRDLIVDGETDTPDFRLTHFGTALPLHTKFHATVDGTNGDTWLNSVDATLAHSHFTTSGQIVRITSTENGVIRGRGHEISLAINIDRARIEDFLRLTSRSANAAPLLMGAIRLTATLDIPPGAAHIHQRMKMKGNFSLDGVRFSSDKVQTGIGQLSLRGQGRPEDLRNTDPHDIHSSMSSSFVMTNGMITLPNLQYLVPGAQIDMKGTYGMEGGTMDFAGTARMQATVSQMVGGWKGLLLKPADRYFSKGGAGTLIPIHLRGTREDPQFGVDLKRLKGASTSPEIPGTK